MWDRDGIFFLMLPTASKSDDALLIGPSQAWGPLARAMRFNHKTVKSVAQKHGKDVAQIMLRWGLQHVSPPSSAIRILSWLQHLLA